MATVRESGRPLGAPVPQRTIHCYNSRPEIDTVTASQLTGAKQAAEYSWRAPSPPVIHVPQLPEDRELILPLYNGIGYEAEERDILQLVTSHRRSVVPVKDWKYEWRRTAQPILTFLHLGPSSAAKDIEYLRREGITMLLVVRDTATARVSLLSGDKMAKELGIESRAVDVAGNQELIAAFPRAIKTINDHLIAVYRQNAVRGTIRPDFLPVTPGRVMVFCESGNERSAVVVAAYLMFMYKLNLIEAIQYVQSQRFCVAFDDGLKNLLQSYNDLLDAQRSVISASITSSQPMAKRGRDKISEDDMDVDLDRGDDEARFGSRSTFAPFYDNAS